MLLKNQKKSPARLLAGAVSVIAFTAASLGATASYGFEDAKKEVHVRTHKEHSKITIHVDGDETMEIKGVKNPAKVEYELENGVRTVRVYNKKGKLISEDVYGPDEEMPFNEVITRTKDGEVHKIRLDRPHEPRMLGLMNMDGEETHFTILSDEDGDVNVQKRFAFVSADGPHAMQLSGLDDNCLHSEGGDGPVVMEWHSEEEGGDKQIKATTHEVICIGGDENADPATRAEALRKAINHMEERAKREAERREKVLAQLRAELKELEKKN